MTRLLVLVTMLAACSGTAQHKRIVSVGPGDAPKLDPVKPEAMKEFQAALRAIKLGGPDASTTARGRFEAAVKLDGTLWEAWHDLGILADQDGDADVAIKAFGKALEVNPTHTPSRLARAEAERHAGNTDDARADYEGCLREFGEEDPLRGEAAARLASLLRDAKKYDDAIEVLRDTLRLQGATSVIYTELGLIYLAEDREDLALLCLAKAIELDAKDPAAHNALALLYLKQNKAQEAFDQFDAATSLDPEYIDARFNKASVLLDAGDYGRAKTELAIVVEKSPDDYAAWVAMGLVKRGLKDYEGAKGTWQDVIDGAPRRDFARADALFDLAILEAFFLNDVETAKKDLERYLQDAPSSHPKRQEAEQKLKELGL